MKKHVMKGDYDLEKLTLVPYKKEKSLIIQIEEDDFRASLVLGIKQLDRLIKYLTNVSQDMKGN